MVRPSFLVIVGVSAIAVALSGCPSTSVSTKPAEPTTKKPSAEKSLVKLPAKPKAGEQAKAQPQTAGKTEPGEEQVAHDVEQAAKKPRDLGPPLVDDPGSLTRLHPKDPVWMDMKNKFVVVQGEACSADCPLEFFATYFGKAYESVVTVNVMPRIVHAGLMRVGAEAGHPARFEPKFSPPTGTEIAIDVRWKDAKGKLQSCPAQQLIRSIKTKKPLDVNWVFAGSIFVTDEETGKESYVADRGDMICVLSSPGAMLDLPMFGAGAIEDRSFEVYKEHMPPAGTPLTLVLKPILSTNPGSKRPPNAAAPAGTQSKHSAAEQRAVAAAETWLALVDRGEYSQAWETSASLLKDRFTRRNFIQIVGDKRKSRGKVTARQLESKEYTTSSPHVPDGQYVALRYKTYFAKKKPAIETVVPMLDKDKKWRVSGYLFE